VKSLEKVFRSVVPHVAIDYIMDSNGNFDTKNIDYHLAFNLQNGGFIEVGNNVGVEVLRTPFRLNSTNTVPVGIYDSHEWFVVARFDPSRSLQPTFRVGTGPFYNGDRRNYQAGLAWRLNYKFNTSMNYTRNDISLPNSARFKTNLLSTRFNYSMSTNVFLNALVQYNSDSKQWTSNVRFNVIHRPLSDFFLVYNERRDSVTGDMVDRAVIAKVTYMFAR
jgi:hypothetical protein